MLRDCAEESIKNKITEEFSPAPARSGRNILCLASRAGLCKKVSTLMITSLSADAVKLRQRKTLPGSSGGGEELLTTLSEKLDELFGAGYERDDIYGLVIPLLMQGLSLIHI